MMKKKYVYFLAVLLCCIGLSSCFPGCGSDKSKELKNENETEFESGGGLVGAVKNLEKAVKSMEENINESMEPINFREFKSNLKEKIDGMERVSYNGETSGLKGFKVSKAEARYEDDDRKMKIEIMDVGGVAFAIMGVAAWSAVEVDKESDTNMERTGTYRGFKIYEKYNHRNNSGEFSAILYDRFVVNIEGRNIKQKEFREFFDDLDLTSLKKYAPKKREEE